MECMIDYQCWKYCKELTHQTCFFVFFVSNFIACLIILTIFIIIIMIIIIVVDIIIFIILVITFTYHHYNHSSELVSRKVPILCFSTLLGSAYQISALMYYAFSFTNQSFRPAADDVEQYIIRLPSSLRCLSKSYLCIFIFERFRYWCVSFILVFDLLIFDI